MFLLIRCARGSAQGLAPFNGSDPCGANPQVFGVESVQIKNMLILLADYFSLATQTKINAVFFLPTHVNGIKKKLFTYIGGGLLADCSTQILIRS